jgi:PAS domain S-box-containing protein
MILMTGQGAVDVDLAALRLGAADYLNKDGLKPGELERSLRYALERQRAGEVLRRSDEYYRAIIDNSQDLVCIIDEKAAIRFESPSVLAMLGYQPDERLGRDFFDFLHPDDTHETGRRLDIAVRSPESEGEGEFRMRHKDGSWRSMEYKAKNLLQLSCLKGVLFNARDITERKRSMEALLKVERLAFLGQLTAGMAHEVRNPLAIIQMSAEMIKESGGDHSEAEARRHASVIVEQCQRLLRLMSETLNYSKNRPSELSELDPRDLLEHSLHLAKVQFGSASDKITQEWIPSQALPPIQADRQKAELVLVNLILNAFQAMGAGGKLGLGWQATGDGVLFIVQDNGPGMSESELDHIFDPFFTTKQQGSGLGLWLCQRMVDAAGGRLGVESGKGRGSRFTVWLPLIGGKA